MNVDISNAELGLIVRALHFRKNRMEQKLRWQERKSLTTSQKDIEIYNRRENLIDLCDNLIAKLCR